MKPNELNAFLGQLVEANFIVQTQALSVRNMNSRCKIIEVGDTSRSGAYVEEYENSLEHYVDCFNEGKYSAIVFDGSLLYIKYKTDKSGKIISHRFGYFPSIVQLHIAEGEGPSELPSPAIYPRTPRRAFLRFEFEPDDATDEHPASHLHFDVAHCRIPVSSRLGVREFIHFVVDAFYPDFRDLVAGADVSRYDDLSVSVPKRSE